MKKYLIYIIMAAFIGMWPLQAEAAGTDALQIENSGIVTIISPQAAEDGASSLQFSLEVSSADAANIEFRFQENSAKVQEFRYDQNTRRLNIYIAGTEPLFAGNADTLTLGTIVVVDGNGSDAAATVSVVADSFAYVYGTELKTVEDMTLPGNVRLGPDADPAPVNTPAPQPTQKPAGDDNSQGGNNGSQGNNNGSQGGNNGSQGDNNNSQGDNNILLGNNYGSQGSNNNSHGNSGSSQGTGGASQENDNDLKEDDNSSPDSDDTEGDNVTPSDSEAGDDELSPVMNSSEESEDLLQKDLETAKETNWGLILVVIVALVIVAAIAVGAVILYKKQSSLNSREKK